MRTLEFEMHRMSDERGFLHKRILGLVKKVASFAPVPGANIIGSIAGRLAGGRATVGAPPPTAQPSFLGGGSRPLVNEALVSVVPSRQSGIIPGSFTGGAPAGFASAGCKPPLVRGRTGLCVFPGSPLGRDPEIGVGGQAITGEFGGGVVPTSRVTEARMCPRGMALGKDALCYRHLPNRDRMWPRGRRPLLTGGDMKALSKAASAGRKLEGATKRLRKLGLMKSATRRAAPHRHAREARGVVSV